MNIDRNDTDLARILTDTLNKLWVDESNKVAYTAADSFNEMMSSSFWENIDPDLTEEADDLKTEEFS